MDKYKGKINRTRNVHGYVLTDVLSTVPETEIHTVILPHPTHDAEWDISHLDDYAVTGRYGVHTYGVIKR